MKGMRRLRDVFESELHLDLTGWTLDSVEDVSANDRTIVGPRLSGGGRWSLRRGTPKL